MHGNFDSNALRSSHRLDRILSPRLMFPWSPNGREMERQVTLANAEKLAQPARNAFDWLLSAN
jgi:hypothetical protein